MSCGIGHRCAADPMLLLLWHRLVAIVLTGPQAWEPLYAIGAALEKTKNKKIAFGDGTYFNIHKFKI